jgi:hypothetical protein
MLQYTKASICAITKKRDITTDDYAYLQAAPSKFQSTAIKLAMRRYESSYRHHFEPQAANIRGRIWTMALNDDNRRIAPIVELKCDNWAYICHDKDAGVPHHYHYYMEFSNARYINSLAQLFDIPAHMLEKVDTKKAMLAYLTHSNDPDKHQYDISEVKANFDVAQASTSLLKESRWRLLHDSIDLYNRKLPIKTFLESNKDVITSMSPSTIIRLGQDLATLSSYYQGQAKVEVPPDIFATKGKQEKLL